MKDLVQRLDNLLDSGRKYFEQNPDSEISKKPNTKKWSKKEILGHLIDSGINNLKRFTEIQFESKPYKVKNYNQDELVKANDYQNSDTKELVEFWSSINKRIQYVINLQHETTLNFEIELPNGKTSNFKFMLISYVDHLEHHLNQIKTNS